MSMLVNHTTEGEAMSGQTYNGWTNYETWAVGMYLDGNYTGEGTYREVLALVEEAAENINQSNVDEGIWTRDEARTFSVEDALKEWFEAELPELDGIAGDLLRAAVDEVNWRELAENKLSEITENAR